MNRVRLDWVLEPVRETVPLSVIQDGFVYHYSIPNFDATGGGAIEDGADIESAKQAVHGGEILISRLNPRKSRVLITTPQDMLAVCSGEFIVFRPRLGVSPEFISYVLQTETTRRWLDANVRSVTRSQQRVDPDIVTKMWIDLPNLAEQKQVVAYLDREISRIDNLLAEQITLARLANARFSSLREGLLVERSDVAWCPLHRLVDPSRPIVYGIVQAGPHVPDGIPYIKTGDVNNLDPERLSRTSPEIDAEYSRARVVPGDIVIAMRASIGSVVLVPSTLPVANLTQGTARIAARRGVSNRWLFHVLKTNAVQQECAVRAVGTTFLTLNLWDLRRVPIPAPPFPDQVRLAQSLDEEEEKLNALRHETFTQSALLEEHRSAVISFAVSGAFNTTRSAA